MENVTEIVTVVETVAVSEAERIVETIHTISVLEVSEPEVIVDEVQVVDIVTESITESVAEEVQVIEIISDEGRQGPPGLAEEDIVYAKRMDMVSPEVFYKGEAETGSVDDAPVWRIRRITMVMLGDLVDLSEQWADGEAAFVHKWTDRLTLTYQ